MSDTTAIGRGVVVHTGSQLRAQFWSIHTRASLVHSPAAAHAGHAGCKSVPQLLIAGGGWVPMIGADESAVVRFVAHDGLVLQLRAQFWSIYIDCAHALGRAAHAGHIVCKSVPQLIVSGGGWITIGAGGAGMKIGAEGSWGCTPTC